MYSSQQEKRTRHLLVIKDNDGFKAVSLEASSYFIGRDPKNSIILAGKSISRQHAILLRISGADPTQFSYVLIDGNLQGQRSKNGTKVNDEGFVSTRLQSGDRVNFGLEVSAKYLTLPNMTVEEIDTYCKDIDLGTHFTEARKTSISKETLVMELPKPQEKEDLSLVRLATFPEIFPIPMFEITSRGQLTYLNPAAHDSFPDLPVMGLEHPALEGLAIYITQSNKNILSREVQIRGHWYEQSIHYISENGLIRCCLLDVTQRKAAEEALRRRDQLSKSVAEVTTHLLTGLHQHTVINDALEMFGSSIGVDRIGLSENSGSMAHDTLAATLKYEWVKSGVSSILKQPHRQNQVYRETYLRRWYPLLAEDGMICSLRKDLPDEERSILFRDGILSLLVVPVNVNNSFWGFLELDYCAEDYLWTPNDIANVQALAASIGAAIQRQQQEQVIQHQAHHDALTGLPNRTLFHKKLELSLSQAQVHNQRVAVMFLDLDKFKVINDTLGHSVGDGLLQEVGERLQQCVRSTDTVARWGGDEFIILMPNLDNLDDAIATAQRILTVFQEECQIEAHMLTINTSIGIAIYPNDALEAEILVRNADIALYQSKDMGRGTYQLYDSGIESESQEVSFLRESLRQGLQSNEFVLYYQPQINLKTNRIVGMESLIRWNHPKYGLMYPSQFLALAEEVGVLDELGDWVLSSAAQQCLDWQRMGFQNICVSINLFEKQFNQVDLVDRVRRILTEGSCPVHCIQLEISEIMAFSNLQYTQSLLQQFHEIGVRVVIDDFGMGVTSLNDLTKLAVKGLKLHKALIKDISSNRNAAAIIHALVSMAKYLNLSVAAVGVDQSDKLNILKSLGCDLIQGYLMAPPLAVEEATLKLQGMVNASMIPTSQLIHS